MEPVLSIEKVRSNRVRVAIAGGEFIVPAASMPQGTLTADPHDLAVLQADCARTDAQRFLEYSERSTGQLHRKMLSLGYSHETAAETVAWAGKYGFVDDIRFSELFIRSRTMGKLRLRLELLKRGVDEEAVETVLSRFSEQSEFQEVTAAVRRKYGGMADRETAYRRAAGWLERRGYSGEFIHRVLRQAL